MEQATSTMASRTALVRLALCALRFTTHYPYVASTCLPESRPERRHAPFRSRPSTFPHRPASALTYPAHEYLGQLAASAHVAPRAAPHHAGCAQQAAHSQPNGTDWGYAPKLARHTGRLVHRTHSA